MRTGGTAMRAAASGGAMMARRGAARAVGWQRSPPVGQPEHAFHPLSTLSAPAPPLPRRGQLWGFSSSEAGGWTAARVGAFGVPGLHQPADWQALASKVPASLSAPPRVPLAAAASRPPHARRPWRTATACARSWPPPRAPAPSRQCTSSGHWTASPTPCALSSMPPSCAGLEAQLAGKREKGNRRRGRLLCSWESVDP